MGGGCTVHPTEANFTAICPQFPPHPHATPLRCGHRVTAAPLPPRTLPPPGAGSGREGGGDCPPPPSRPPPPPPPPAASAPAQP